MRNLSSAFKDELNNDNRRYLEWVDITLKDGTVLNLREDSIWNNGIKVEDAVSSSSEFQIGSAIVNKATVTLNNIYDDFSDYIFDGASISMSVGLTVKAEVPTEAEKIHLFTGIIVEAPTTNSSVLSLTCYDNMYKFDRDYSESNLSYPATRGQIIRDACSVCGVQLQTVTFDNDDYIIQEKPSVEQLTFRQLISWVAQIGGQFCRCDSLGRLCIGWYDLKSYEADTMKDGSYIPIKSYDNLSVNNEDVVITGIRVTEYRGDSTSEDDSVSFLYGKDGYVIDIKDNKLVFTGKGEEIATMMGKRIVGMRFRPFSVSMMNNPAVEAGDICLITDRKGNQYKSLITSSTFQIGNKQPVSCGAKSAVRNSAKQYSLTSQAIVENRNNIKKEKKDREKALEEFANRVGLSAGLFTTVEHSDGGGNIFYLHNKVLLKDSDIVWKMTAEAWSVSTDGGQTWNGGMTVDGDTIVRILDAVGVRANWIQTGEFKVEDEDGNEVFYVNCDTGVVRIKAQSFLLSGTSIEEISKKQLDAFVEGTYKSDMSGINGKIDTKNANYYQSSDPSLSWTTITEEALADIDGNPILDVDGNEILIRVESEKIAHEDDVWKNTSDNVEYIYKSGNWVRVMLPNDIMEQFDGKIDSYFKDYEPTLNNYPANEWLTDNDRASHNGDLFYWKSTGMCYRFVQIDGVWQWYNVKDKDIEKALENASKAQDTADGKRRNFITTPVPPYDVGDLWTQGSTGDLMRCKTARASGNYNSSDWVLATKYTDDTVANKAIAQIKVLDGKISLKVTADDVESLIEQKAESIRLKALKISWDSLMSSMTEEGYLTCKGAEIDGTLTTRLGNIKTEIIYGRTRYSWGDTVVGVIGTNRMTNNNSKKGLVFDLEYDGSYMGWFCQEKPSDNTYNSKLTYASTAFSGFTGNAINVGCNLDMHGWTIKNPSFDNGVTQTINYVQVLEIDSNGIVNRWGNNGMMKFKNGILIDLSYYTK